ncbi:MAG TPA: YceD family protein [Rhodanobacteraceae bacterium]|nr:YceD family protein [Rhodanobacteraceae bacterium]
MSAPLPERMDAERMVAARRSFQGKLPVASLERLSAALADARGEVEFDLEFGLAAPATRCLVVRAAARVALECQRSLEIFEYPLSVDVRLGLIRHERDEAGLPAGFEPLLLEDGVLYPTQVIEDELLLALPPYPVKPGAEEAEPKTWDGERWTIAPPDDAERKQNPFAILRELKKK